MQQEKLSHKRQLEVYLQRARVHINACTHKNTFFCKKTNQVPDNSQKDHRETHTDRETDTQTDTHRPVPLKDHRNFKRMTAIVAQLTADRSLTWPSNMATIVERGVGGWGAAGCQLVQATVRHMGHMGHMGHMTAHRSRILLLFGTVASAREPRAMFTRIHALHRTVTTAYNKFIMHSCNLPAPGYWAAKSVALVSNTGQAYMVTTP
jgi:hypothetical protein